MFRYEQLPEHIRDGVRLYVESGVPPGGFLTALISNDLKEACGRADDINGPRIQEIVGWFWNEAPSPCWGSHQKFTAWIARGGVNGGTDA